MAEQYSVKVENGFVKLFKQGAPVRTMCGGAKSAAVNGTNVFVEMKDGQAKVFDIRGFYRGTR